MEEEIKLVYWEINGEVKVSHISFPFSWCQKIDCGVREVPPYGAWKITVLCLGNEIFILKEWVASVDYERSEIQVFKIDI